MAMSDEMIPVEDFRAQARAWLSENLERIDPAETHTRIRGVDHKTVEGVIPERELQRKIYDGGYAGISFPKACGGQGLTNEHERVFNEESEYYRTPDFGVLGGTTMGVCARTMLVHAAPAFLERHIPRILAGEELWVQFFSEPEAGSDLAGIRTRATRDGERWILNGSKIWSSGAYYSDYGMCLARTNWDVPKHRGLTWFAVPATAPGLTIRPIKEINGDAEFCEEFFDGVEVTDDDIIGEVDQGWSVTQTMLVFERGTSRPALSTSQRRALAPDLVSLARTVGRDKDPVARQLVARAHINDVARAELRRRIASRMRSSQGLDHGIAAYGKLATGTMDPIRARIGMEIGGGQVLTWDHGDIDGMTTSVNYLNGRVLSIAGGSNEMQRNGIGERVLGLPREPSFDTNKPFTEVVRNAKNWTGRVD
jgi:alkylation response protein AidB-like acyl-CoA dehydrogenase